MAHPPYSFLDWANDIVAGVSLIASAILLFVLRISRFLETVIFFSGVALIGSIFFRSCGGGFLTLFKLPILLFYLVVGICILKDRNWPRGIKICSGRQGPCRP